MVLFKQISKIMTNTLVLFMLVSPLGMTAVNAASPSTGTVVITVTDSSGKALSNSIVDDQVTGTVVETNSSGVATFSNLKPGSYSFLAGYRGFQHPAPLPLIVTANKITSGTIVVPMLLSAVVTVEFNDGTAINGATVELNGTTATTNNSGVATFDNVPRGTYTYTVHVKPMYAANEPDTYTRTVTLTDENVKVTLVTDLYSPWHPPAIPGTPTTPGLQKK
jgi:hypothetical protein